MRLPPNPLTKGVVRLSPRDAEFIYNESDGHLGHLVAVWFFDTTDQPEAEFTQDEAVKWVTRRLGHARFFTNTIQRVKLGIDHPYWVPAADFDVYDHVTATTLTEPGWAALGGPLSEILTTPVDLSRPPWEMHFFSGVEGLEDVPGRLTAVALKSHHSTGDGLALRALGEQIFRDRLPAPVVRATVAPVPYIRQRTLVSSIVGVPAQAFRFAQGIVRTGGAMKEITAAKASGEIVQNLAERPATRFNGKASGAAAVQPITISVADAKRVKDGVPGATVNDVLLAVVGGAMARYLADAGEPHDGSIVAMVPRSMRKVEKWESENQLEVLGVDMHTDIADPLERLAAIAVSARAEKDRTSHLATRKSATRIDTAPPVVLRFIAYARTLQPYSLDRPRFQHTTVSNIPLSVDGLSLAGAPGAAVLAIQPPTDGDGLRHFMVAAAGGGLTINVIVDPEMMPDLDHYLGLIRESFDELKKAAGV